MTDFDCKTCGACCTNHQLILVRPGDNVPFTMMADGHRMRQREGRCIALLGRVGKLVECTIYENRPAVCKALAIDSWACRAIREGCGMFNHAELGGTVL